MRLSLHPGVFIEATLTLISRPMSISYRVISSPAEGLEYRTYFWASMSWHNLLHLMTSFEAGAAYAFFFF